jgi:biopolymer transport protein ExbB
VYSLLQPIDNIREFLESGGYVLWVILFVTILLWSLIIERYWYLRIEHPKILKALGQQWQSRLDTRSWYARSVREALISETSLKLNQSLRLINTLIMLCPLLGLIGTVTGMIQVFDVIAVLGTGNARAVASGISMATIPTMAGLVTALSGYYFSARLKHHVSIESLKTAELLSD